MAAHQSGSQLGRRVAAEIKQVARLARRIDPETCGRISYASMCGGLQSIMCGLVREIAGPSAADLINAAFEDAYADDSEDARAAIGKVTGSAT